MRPRKQNTYISFTVSTTHEAGSVAGLRRRGGRERRAVSVPRGAPHEVSKGEEICPLQFIYALLSCHVVMQAGSVNPTVTLWLVELDEELRDLKSTQLRPPEDEAFG